MTDPQTPRDPSDSPFPAPGPDRTRPQESPGSAGVEQVHGEAGHLLGAGDSGRAPSPSVPAADHDVAGDFVTELPPELSARRRTRTRRRVPEPQPLRQHFTARQRLLILDTWQRSKLPAKDFSALVGLSPHSLYKWRSRFAEEGPAGLEDQPRGPTRGSRLSEETKRAILMMKQAHPEWGQDRLHSMLMRTQGLGASPGAIGRYLEQEGYVVEDVPTKPHPDKPRRFERARPNQMWQTDLFTFVLKRQNRRVHLVGFMDDYSRFLVGFGLHASSSGAMVRETLEAAIANHGAPEEVLTDNGTQYKTWRGKSAFTKLLERRGIKQIVASPRHPQTLGKIERFWGTLWRECVQQAVFRDLDDARERIRQFIDHYNFQRTHSGIDGMVPADRFFESAPQVLSTLREQVASNAKELAQNGTPRKPFYLTGRVGDANISLHAEGERVVLTKEDGSREEVDLGATGRRDEVGSAREVEGPGASPLDGALRELRDGFARGDEGAVDDFDGEVVDEDVDVDDSACGDRDEGVS